MKKSLKNGLFKAFTLVELLVVLGLIAAISAIAFPVTRGVIDQSKATKDVSNLRHIGMAASLYASDYGCLMGEACPSLLYPTYLTNWNLLQSGFDQRGATPDNPISYDMNCELWGINLQMIVSRSECILFAPLMSDPATRQFASTRRQPSLPSPLTIQSNGTAEKGGTHRDGSEIIVLFADMHASPLPMSAFHTPLVNPDRDSSVADLRWNKLPKATDLQ